MIKLKKIIACAVCVLVLLCAGCKPNDSQPSGVVETIDKLALITSNIELELDFNYAAVWEGIQTYSTTNNINYGYYRPGEMTEEAITEQFEYAVLDGATVIMCMGDVFIPVVKKMQTKYPSVKFVAIDASAEELGTVEKNTHTIMFRQEQGGYLAGYGAVKDGMKKLGFFGDHPGEAYNNYLYGFVQGANDAAKLTGESIEINVAYRSDHPDDASALGAVEEWYKNGTEVVMCCADDIFTRSLAQTAVSNMGYVIGTNNDQSYLGADLDYNPFITSSMKGLREAVDATLEMMLAGAWEDELGGRTLYFGLQNGNYIYLPEYEATWLFDNFTLDEYGTLKNNIATGQILIDGTKLPVSELVTVNTLNTTE